VARFGGEAQMKATFVERRRFTRAPPLGAWSSADVGVWTVVERFENGAGCPNHDG
jgi:hypothetical protein